jgi:FixJ family two-component response regulator
MFPIPDQTGSVRCIGGIAQEITVHDGMQAYVIGPDAKSQEDLSHLLQRAGYAVKGFASPAEFLQVSSVLTPGCAVLDVRSSYAEGLAVLRQLKGSGSDLPIVVTGMSHGDVLLAVQVMKAGAADWLELPYEDDTMLMAVASALAGIRRSEDLHRDAELARVRVAGMSARERQVLEGLLAGGTNKTIARELGISPRTVELHRASVMERLGVSTLPEAVLMAVAAGVRPSSRFPQSKTTTALSLVKHR